jgi:hypothetical protein
MKILEKSSLCKAEGPNNYLNNIYSNLLRHRRRIIPRDPAIFMKLPRLNARSSTANPYRGPFDLFLTPILLQTAGAAH